MLINYDEAIQNKIVMLKHWTITINHGMKKWQEVCGIQRKTIIGKTGCRIMAQLEGFLWHEQNISRFDNSSPDSNNSEQVDNNVG